MLGQKKSFVEDGEEAEDGLSNNPISFLTLGLKMMIGVALVSNLCIGTLMVVNRQANKQVSHKNEVVTALRDTLSENLREEIVNLQDKYLQIPNYLEVDPAKDIFDWVKKHHPIQNEQTLEGRSNYKSFFKRTQRRDVGKGRFVVHMVDGQLMLSKGILDGEGNFQDAVKMMQLTSTDPQADLKTVSAKIAELSEADNTAALKRNIAALNGTLADEAIKAEKTRTQIVEYVDRIAKEDEAIKAFSNDKQKLTTYIAVATVLLNVLVLHLLTWYIVEKPLRKLYVVIKRIQSGKDTRIPYQRRRDKVGVLARTIREFKEALGHLQQEDVRKQQEQKIIKGLITQMTDTIGALQSRSSEMSHAASALNELAHKIEEGTSSVNQSSSHTAALTDDVSEAAIRLKGAVENIGSQIDTQNALVQNMTQVASAAKGNMTRLDKASNEIASIIQIVKDIAAQTKLLALNAGIEAARAGASGKGFIVVAAEIKALSNQTEVATSDIAEKIGGIQQASNHIIESIGSIEVQVNELTSASGQIDKAVNDQKSATTDIARNADLTSSETKEVSESISEVEKVAEQTLQLAGEVSEHAVKMSDGLGQLLNQAMEKISEIGLDFNELRCVRESVRSIETQQSKIDADKECITNPDAVVEPPKKAA